MGADRSSRRDCGRCGREVHVPAHRGRPEPRCLQTHRNALSMLPIVHLIGTGGSISCIGESRTDFLDYAYRDRHYTIEEMIARVPELKTLAEVRFEQFMNAYGGEVSPDRWLALGRRVNAIF